MLKIEIREASCEERDTPYVDKKGVSKVARFRDQTAWAFVTMPNGQPTPYPQKISISLQSNEVPYPAGMYSLAPESIYVGRFDKLQIGKIKLKPLVAAHKAAA